MGEEDFANFSEEEMGEEAEVFLALLKHFVDIQALHLLDTQSNFGNVF